MKTAFNNVVLPTLFNVVKIVVNNIVQHCYTWLRANSGSTMLNNIVDNIEQCGQHNIVQGCFHQPWTSCAFFAVYACAAAQSYTEGRHVSLWFWRNGNFPASALKRHRHRQGVNASVHLLEFWQVCAAVIRNKNLDQQPIF